MAVEKSGFDLALGRLESSAGHVSFTDGFNLLESELVAQLIEGKVNGVKQVEQLLSLVGLHYAVELVDVDEDHCHLSFVV